MRLVSGEEVYDMIGDSRYAIIDLRSKEEYSDGHIQGAVNFPNAGVNTVMRYVPRNKQIVLYCERGISSALLARELERYGYTAMSVVGGAKSIHKSIDT